MSGMNDENRLDEDRDVERALAGLTARPVPPGLKTRVLESARAARREVVMTSRMWAVATACLVLIFMSVAGDRMISGPRIDDIPAFADRPAASAPSDADIGPVLVELGIGDKALEGGPGEKSFLVRSLLSRMGPGPQGREETPDLLKILEGWTDDEGTKNPY